MKVRVIHKNGREEMMSRRFADILSKMGRVTYQTRDMQAEPARPEPAKPATDEAAQLRAELDKRGIKYHHRAGVAKLRELLG